MPHMELYIYIYIKKLKILSIYYPIIILILLSFRKDNPACFQAGGLLKTGNITLWLLSGM